MEGVGRLRPITFTRTETGMFVFGSFVPGLYRVAVHEWAPSELEDTTDMPLDELREAVARVVGGDVPMRLPEGEHPALRRGTGLNSRQAAAYRQGQVFLVGDAAHVYSAVGGPGLNLGMQDVLNLGWKLAAEVHGWAPEGLLDTYESERYPVGERVIMHTRAQMALLSPGPNITALRELFEELLRDQGTTRHIADLMAGADVRYDPRGVPAHPMTGRWMPDLALKTRDGATRVAEVVRGGRPVLLAFTDHAAYAGAARGWADRVDVVAAGAEAAPADAVLIRPDGYVAWAAGAAGELPAALRTWFGAPAS